jgi:hypothetical protein
MYQATLSAKSDQKSSIQLRAHKRQAKNRPFLELIEKKTSTYSTLFARLAVAIPVAICRGDWAANRSARLVVLQWASRALPFMLEWLLLYLPQDARLASWGEREKRVT